MDAKAWRCQFVVGPNAGGYTILCGAPSRDMFCRYHARLLYYPAREVIG